MSLPSSNVVIPAARAFEANVERRSYMRAGLTMPAERKLLGVLDDPPDSLVELRGVLARVRRDQAD